MEAYSCVCLLSFHPRLFSQFFIIKKSLRLVSKSQSQQCWVIYYTKGCMCPFDYVLCWSNKSNEWLYEGQELPKIHQYRNVFLLPILPHQSYPKPKIMKSTPRRFGMQLEYKLTCQFYLFSTVHLEVWVMVYNSHMPNMPFPFAEAV